MISCLRGKILSAAGDSFIIDISGFGIEVFATGRLISSAVIGEDLFCLSYMQISDSGAVMFGFSTERERMLFLELIQVKTVGGKLAMTLLRHLDADQILKAIANDDAQSLSVPGLGVKRAERICFELKNKLAKKFGDINSGDIPWQVDSSLDRVVADALTGLGFTQSESIKALSTAKALSAEQTQWTEESLLKSALSILQRR